MISSALASTAHSMIMLFLGSRATLSSRLGRTFEITRSKLIYVEIVEKASPVGGKGIFVGQTGSQG